MPADLPRTARTLLTAWDENRARVGDLLVSEAVLVAVEGIRAAVETEEPRHAHILYTNHRGETGWRTIIPRRLWFGVTEWHPEPAQWLLRAWDCEKEADRDFALHDIHEWAAGEVRGRARPCRGGGT